MGRKVTDVTNENGRGPILAIFDLDKTIIDTSASMAYGRPMAERGLIGTPEQIADLIVRAIVT